MANELLATCLAQSRRPLSLVEDAGFGAFVSFITETIGGTQSKYPAVLWRDRISIELLQNCEQASSPASIA